MIISIGPRAAGPAEGSDPEGVGELDAFVMYNMQHSKGRMGIGPHAGLERGGFRYP